jgi:ribosomal protein S12 methylthiotransferase
VLERIKQWRQDVPDIAVRSTFIVGFPGETDEDFEQLLDFLEEAKIDRAGCFKYEDVKGAVSHDLPNHVPEDMKEERWHRFMQLQQEISHNRSEAQVGKKIEIIIDDVDGNNAVGRTKADAPEIDGLVNVEDYPDLKAGDIVEAKVTDADFYDLWATVPDYEAN